jgi:hypothetical protein
VIVGVKIIWKEKNHVHENSIVADEMPLYKCQSCSNFLRFLDDS